MRPLLLLFACTLTGAVAQEGKPANPVVVFGPQLPPPLPPMPLDFRQLLAMSQAERDKVLAKELPAKRQIIESKLKEYDELSGAERESRLQAVQLWLYLRPLMKVAPAHRVEWLKAIPQPDHDVIAKRLEAWDHLSPEMQRELLENELAVSVLVHPEMALPGARPGAAMTPQRQAIIDAAIARWRALPDEARHRINDHFQVIFELDEQQKARSLQGLSDDERIQMERTLEAFARLSPAKREACVAGLERFVRLSASERSEFLRNAHLWQKLTPHERNLWRELVRRFRSPHPPMPPPMPPRLPQAPPRADGNLASTNN